MTDLEDRAQETEDVILARDSHGMYRLEDSELTNADELGTDEFPKYGEFLEVEKLSRSGAEQGTAYVECPQNLAATLVQNGIGEGDQFLLRNVAKDTDGNWTFEAETDL